MRKLYILDTSVLIDDPGAFKSYKDSEVIIPIAVINELDSKKHYLGESGKNARVCIKMLDEISSIGDINTGVLLDNETLIKVDVEYRKISDKSVYSGFGDPKYTDTHILACAYDYDRDSEYDDVTLVTNDFNLRIKAKARGINSEGHLSKFSFSDLYAGSQVIVNEQAAFELQQESFIDPNFYNIDMNLHECVLFTDNDDNGLAMGRKVNDTKIKLIRKNYPWGIKSRNKEQTFAIDLMLDKGIDLVTLIGKAGCGKSLLALACALEQVINKHDYEKLIIYRPIQAVSNDIGYLPGELSEKLAPWFQAIMDNFEYLFRSKNGDWKKDLEMYQKKGRVEMEAITYIRGRSIPKSIIMVDECFPYDQNIETNLGKKRIGILYDMWKSGKKLPLIKTYNEEKSKFEYKQITHAWNRGKKSLIKITCGNREIKCTDNHKFLTKNGWVKGEDLNIGDFIKTTEPKSHQILRDLNEDQLQIILGSFLGDGSISNHGLNRYRLREIHGISQKEYCEWKGDVLHAKQKFIEKNGYSEKPAIQIQTKMFGLDKHLPNNKSYCPDWAISKLDAKGLAIWFMDDGSVNSNYNGAQLSTCSFDLQTQMKLVKKINSMGIDCKISFCNMKGKRAPGYYYLSFKKRGYEQLCSVISPYVHKSMIYKVNNATCDYNWNDKYHTCGLTVVDNIEFDIGNETVYDIEVEDNHNFIVCSTSHKTLGGLIAHNCQNLNKEDIKTILTRIGEGSKIILTGDIEQIDNSSLDAANNGLSYVIEKFKNKPLSGHVTLTQGERSRLATLASEIL